MKRTFHFIGMMLILGILSMVAQADPIEDLSMKDYQAGWYPNYYKQQGPMTCPETCKRWVGTRAEQESVSNLLSDFTTTHVCKTPDNPEIVIEPKNDPSSHWLYGNQLDDKPNCYIGTPYGTKESPYYMCLCVKPLCNKPDLTVTVIYDPVWDNTSGQSKVSVEVKNIGTVTSVATYTRIRDIDTGSVSYATTPSLAPGASVVLLFAFNYWVFDPDAHLEVITDYKNPNDECDETNNLKIYYKQG